MKRAGLKRGSKKKQQEEPTKASADALSVTSNTTSSTNGERRKPTSEEAALTSKNYRLAKELSELRVRHRDETKNVTRLTMENMNLASRCREAISHVAMLKKELAMHQKRASEALAMQRQQNQRTSSSHSEGVLSELSDLAKPSVNSVPSSTDVAVEMDRMDRIMASHAPPPPPPQKDGEDVNIGSDSSPRKGEDGDSPTSSHSSSSRGEENDQNTADVANTSSVPSLFPHTASPKPKHRINYNDDYPGDVAPHRASHESSLPAVQDEDDEPLEQTPPVSHAREVANIKLSSIDAFEASFDTAFPSSFTSPKEGENITSEIYNPFFSSPQKKGVGARSPLNRDVVAEDAGSPDKGRKWGNSLRDHSSVVRKSPTRGSADENPNESMPKMSTPGQQPTIEDDEDRARYDARSPDRNKEYIESSMRMPDPSSSPKIVSRASNSSYTSGGASGEQYHTPPHFQQKAQEPEQSSDQPRRPEKSISAAARARYEKALQPRGYHSRMKDPSSDLQVETKVDATTEARNSPGTVLRRLQQRRTRSERFQPSMDPNSNPIPGLDTRRTSRPLRHPPVLPTESESPFDESNRKVDRSRISGRNTISQNGASLYRNSQNESENYRQSRTLKEAAKKLSPDSMNAEIRALDAMAGSYQKPGDESPTGSELSHNSGSSSSSSRYPALKQRRNVKQPVSYAEPPLNSKIRRGDVYFEKEEDSSPVAISPTGSSPEDVNGSRRTSRTRAGASPDEVLKDLGAAVRS